MLQRSTVVFDDYQAGSNASNPGITSVGTLELLGAYDQLILEVWIEQVNAAGSFDLHVQHSADGTNYSYVTTQASDPPAIGTGDISIATLSTTAVNRGWCKMGNSKPLLAFVRLRMFYNAGTTHGWTRVVAHQRDHGKRPKQTEQHAKHPTGHTRPQSLLATIAAQAKNSIFAAEGKKKRVDVPVYDDPSGGNDKK